MMTTPCPPREQPLILIVDDDADILEATREFLQLNGFNVITAEDGGVGLDLALEERPDLMLIDLALPVIDGLEVVKRMKSMAATTKILVMAFTGHAFGSNSAEARSAGFDAVFTKPGKPPDLLRKVRALLTRVALG